MADPDYRFNIIPHTNPTSAATRAELIANPGFGKIFTDHMVTVRYTEGQGWHDAQLGPRQPIPLDPATAVLHYAQEIFEGLKAYRIADGGTVLFRPEANARRMAQSARQLAMPPVPEEIFLGAVRELVSVDRDWIPDIEGGSLYLRPFMFASEAFLGVRPAHEYLFVTIASPVGGYFRSGAAAVTLWVSRDHSRAAPGGTGSAKCGGNYAASLTAQAEATAHGCDQVVFLDAAEFRWIEELGGMNIFFLFDDGTLLTPPLDGSILPGITRDSVLRLASDAGLKVREERYALDDWRADVEAGRVRETFACGTAAVITAIGTVRDRDGEFRIGDGGPGKVTMQLHEKLTGIQRGILPDPYGWVHRLF
ncbi:MAG: branched-chain amino acid aminotransferase [Sphingomonadaceae bacterium]